MLRSLVSSSAVSTSSLFSCTTLAELPLKSNRLPHLFDGLIESVCDLGGVDLRDDVKGVLLRHLTGRITSKREHVKACL